MHSGSAMPTTTVVCMLEIRVERSGKLDRQKEFRFAS
jgi:hypothetical protein